MATGIPLKDLGTELERRIAARMKQFEPDSPKLKEALLRIGFLIENEAKRNIRRQGAIDTGSLLNSVQSHFFKDGDRTGIQVGSFGVPYAAINEFGGPFTDRQRRAMFAALRDRGKLGRDRVSKGVISGGTYRARPYLMPAVKAHKQRIIEIIRGLFR